MANNTLSSRGNLFDVLKFKRPDAKGAISVANTLIETLHFIQDMPSVPANGNTWHQGLRVQSLPSGSMVDIGGTWGASKTERTPFVECLATIRDSYESPLDVLKTEGPEISKALVADEKINHIEGNGQAWSNLLLNGPSTPTQNSIVGLMDRAPWATYDNEFCYNVGGTGNDLRSAWLIQPSITTVHLLHNPNHPTLGVEMEDKTGPNGIYKVDPDDPTKHNYWAVIEFMLQQGLCIRDQRAVKRLANIPCAITDYSGPDVITYAITASLKHNTLANRPWFMYCDGDLYAQLVNGTNQKLKVYTSNKNIYQTELPMIGSNIIIRRWDSLNHASGSGETVVASA